MSTDKAIEHVSTDKANEDLIQNQCRDVYEQMDKPDLYALYDSFTQRFVSDNQNIWIANSIFTPAAFAALAVHFTVSAKSFWELGSLFIASLGLAGASLIIAEKHKLLQTASWVELQAIERALQKGQDSRHALGEGKGVSPRSRWARIAKRRGSIERARHFLIWVLLIGWALAFVTTVMR